MTNTIDFSILVDANTFCNVIDLIRLEGTMEKPRLLDEVRQTCRVRHHSIRTEKAYIHWIKRYISFHNKRHPKDMGAPEINAFLRISARP